MQRQPDALEPDDEHEHQAAATQRSQQAGEQTRTERSDLEQLQLEHRIVDPRLDDAKGDQKDNPTAKHESTTGFVHPMALPAIGLNSVGDADHDQDQAQREGDVSRPVDAGWTPRTQFSQERYPMVSRANPRGPRPRRSDAS